MDRKIAGEIQNNESERRVTPRIAFYAPMKAPTHAVPSGDRRMARLLWQLIAASGFTPLLASDFRSYDKSGETARQDALKKQGLEIADKLIDEWENLPTAARPKAWFTYHLYHKAPDWLGPPICAHFDIPYLVAEASHAPKRKNGSWHLGYSAAEAAIRAADRVFYMTRLDRECLQPLAKSNDSLVFLPPFLNNDFTRHLTAESRASAREIFARAGGQAAAQKLLCVAMMRGGDKMDSYAALAAALGRLARGNWQLIIVGDGEHKDQVKALFAGFEAGRVVFVGQQPAEYLPAFYDLADLYVWPAIGEAYGMAFLEAQACALPVIAGDTRGVPDVVKAGASGVLVPLGDERAFAAAIDGLLADTARRRDMSKAAVVFVGRERSFDAAGRILQTALEGVIS